MYVVCSPLTLSPPPRQVIRSVLEGPDGAGDRTCFTLFFQNRTEQDILLRQELQMLASAFPARLKVFFFLSNPKGESWGTDFAQSKGFKAAMSSTKANGMYAYSCDLPYGGEKRIRKFVRASNSNRAAS